MIHFLAHHLADKLFGSRLSLGLILVAGAVLWVRTWLGGTTNTWEREWRGKRVIVVVRPRADRAVLAARVERCVSDADRLSGLAQGPPTALTLALLDHLASLSAPTLYLAPALPPSLVTVLAAIRLRAPPSSVVEGADELLTAEAVDPRDRAQVLAFVRAWANRADGVSGSGRRVDAVVWAYGVGSVAHPALLSETGSELVKEVDRPSLEMLTLQEEEHARFLFFTAFLPQILHAVQTSAIKSLRIVALVDPIYPAGFKTSPLLHPIDPPTSDSSPAPVDGETTEDPAAAASIPFKEGSATPNATIPQLSKPSMAMSAAVIRAHHALRSIVFVSHFQRILDALARENEALSTIPLPSADSAQPAAAADTTHREAKGETLEPAAANQVKEERRSAVLVTAVSPGWHFSSVLWPFLARQSPGSLLVPTLCVTSGVNVIL